MTTLADNIVFIWLLPVTLFVALPLCMLLIYSITYVIKRLYSMSTELISTSDREKITEAIETEGSLVQQPQS